MSLGITASRLMKVAATTAAVGAADPEPTTKAVILIAAATAAVGAIAGEAVARTFRWIFDD